VKPNWKPTSYALFFAVQNANSLDTIIKNNALYIAKVSYPKRRDARYVIMNCLGIEIAIGP